MGKFPRAFWWYENRKGAFRKPVFGYTYPQLLIQKIATGPGSVFNRHGGSIFSRRQHLSPIGAQRRDETAEIQAKLAWRTSKNTRLWMDYQFVSNRSVFSRYWYDYNRYSLAFQWSV